MGWIDEFVLLSQKQLDDRVREALWVRGVSEEQIERYQIGYVGEFLPALEFPKPFLDWTRRGPQLEDVYVLPLTNTLGQTLGLQFRSADRDIHGYRDYFLTRAEPVLFGLGQAMPSVWKEGKACVVEGAFDVFPVQRALPYTFSTLTSKIGEDLLRVLKRLVRQVYLFYDSDSTGRDAVRDFVKQQGTELSKALKYPIPPVVLPNGKAVKDPAELWEAWGDEQLIPYLQAQISE